jgi:hypothetical protein
LKSSETGEKGFQFDSSRTRGQTFDFVSIKPLSFFYSSSIIFDCIVLFLESWARPGHPGMGSGPSGTLQGLVYVSATKILARCNLRP